MVCRLCRRGGRSHPRGIGEIEEFRHVHLGGVARGEARQIEACFDELENCRVVSSAVGDVVLARKWRDDDEWNPVTRVIEVASWTVLPAASAHIT